MSAPDAIILALYPGLAMHTRVKPKRHVLRARLTMALIAIGPAMKPARRALFGRDCTSPISFWQTDYGDGGGDLFAWVGGHLSEAGIAAPARATILTMPRIFGFAFNPLSLYFCYDHTDELLAIIYEVKNTFGQRHAYIAAVAPGTALLGTKATQAGQAIVTQATDKKFYVSPFNPMSLHYRFRVRPPAETMRVSIGVHDDAGLVMMALFSGRQRPADFVSLAGLILFAPIQGFAVLARIHLEAAKLWQKGLLFHKRPAAPAQGASVV